MFSVQECRPGKLIPVCDPRKVTLMELCGCGMNLTTMGKYRDLVHYRFDSEAKVPCVNEKTTMYVINQ